MPAGVRASAGIVVLPVGPHAGVIGIFVFWRCDPHR
jgi:hypothetical protein